MNIHIHTTVYEIDENRPTAEHTELYSTFCNNLQGESLKEDIEIDR